jgi:hypothetical protein
MPGSAYFDWKYTSVSAQISGDPGDGIYELNLHEA